MRPLVVVLAALSALLAAAPAARAARAWSAPAPLVSPVRHVTTSAAVLPDGRVALAWQPAGTDETWAAVLPDGLAPARLGDGVEPKATASANGHVLFTWRDGPWSGDATGRARTWTAQAGLGDPVELAAPLDATLTATNPAGDLIVASGSFTSATSRYWPADGALGPAVALGDGRLRALGLGPGGHVVAAVTDGSAVRAVRQTGGGVAVGAGTIALPGDLRPGGPIGVDRDGRAVLPLQGSSLDADGSSFAAAVGVPGRPWSALAGTPARASAPSLTTDPGGGLVAAWTDSAGIALASGSIDDGLGAVQRPEAEPLTASARLVTAPDGTSLVAYRRPGSVRVVRRDGHDAFQPAQTAVCPPSASEDHSPLAIGLDAQGGAVLVSREFGRDLGLFVTRDRPSASPVDGCARVAEAPAPVGEPTLTPGPPGGDAPAVPDGQRSAVNVVSGQRLRGLLRRGLRVAVIVPAAARGTVSLVVPKRQARRLRIGRRATTIGRRTVALRAGPTLTMVRVAQRLRRRLAKARRLTVLVRVRTAGGRTFATRTTLRR